MKNPILHPAGALFLAFIAFCATSASVFSQSTYTGDGLWTDVANWDTGATPPDNAPAIINGTCEIAENIGATNTFNPNRITIGQGTVGVLNVTGGILSGAHGGNAGIFVGEGAGGNGTVTIAQGSSLRSQGGGQNVRIGDDAGGIGFVSVAGELLNFKFMEVINGTLEMLPTGINNKFNEVNPSWVGANGILSFVIDGAEVGALERANGNGLQLTLETGATLKIALEGSFAINDSWTLISYSSLAGEFAQGTEFTNEQGYTFDVDYGTGTLSEVILTLTSDEERPQVASFAATPPSSAAGAAVQLQWEVSNFDTLSIDQGVGDVTDQGGQGSVTVNPTETTTYTLTAILGAVTVNHAVTVVVDELPEIVGFTASVGTIAPGDASTLTWNVSGATSVTISEGVGSVAGQGSQPVSPAATTTYTLTATNGTGSVQADATVTVDAVAAALLNQYLAQAPGQSSGALIDGVGSSNFDVRNGDLRAVSGSDHTTFTQELGRANNAATDGGDNGDGFDLGKTFELWVRAPQLSHSPEVIFDAGSSANGFGLIIDQQQIRVIQSSGGIRTGDVSVGTPRVNTLDDFVQIVVTLDSDGGMLGLSAKGAAGGATSATGAGSGVPVGRAGLFSWSGFGGAVEGSLGGLGDGAVPLRVTTFKGAVALINVYARVLSEPEIADAFSRWTVDVPVVDFDNDLLPDFWEQRHFGNLDATPAGNGDSDSLTNAEELVGATSPVAPDTDFDGLGDPTEVAGDTDQTDPDTDNDLLTDGEEVNGNPSSDPLLVDTDADTFSDSVEVDGGSDPNDAGSLPTAFIGQAPVVVDQTAGTAVSYSTLYPDLDRLDATFRLCVDFDEKVAGEREILFETGGGGVGHSLVYEAGNQLVLRASGNAVLGEVFYTLSPTQVAAGDLEIVWTYAVIDELDEGGRSTISLFVDGVLVGSDSDTLGADWSGTNGSSFGVVLSGISGIDGGGDLTAVNFISGTINLRKGLQFYSDVLFVPSAGDLRVTNVSYDGINLMVTFVSESGVNYSVRESADLGNWDKEATDVSASGSLTTVSVPYDAAGVPRIYVRVQVAE
ncbi:MAG: hypothetical protein ACI9NC_003705 [Verrucomicrobiales bacterium]|jgi:hypothetical protein